jgi:hypothetical protein
LTNPRSKQLSASARRVTETTLMVTREQGHGGQLSIS